MLAHYAEKELFYIDLLFYVSLTKKSMNLNNKRKHNDDLTIVVLTKNKLARLIFEFLK
jgi:hypothetical protein